MAQSVRLRGARPCPELGVTPTCWLNARTSQFDPKQSFPCGVGLFLRQARLAKTIKEMLDIFCALE
jgi:hypothetical protein